MKYQPTIGLEVHIELKTRSKMFCSCSNDPNEIHPNINVCPICLGHPGALPTINQAAVRKTVKTGLSLNCQIPEYSKFDRKNYFYPDLPKGYQISQYDAPFCVGGYLEMPSEDEIARSKNSRRKTPSAKPQLETQNFKKIRIRRVHLEEDTARLLHPEGADYSLVDFNRAGIPLMELVTEPDLNSAKEARRFAEELWLILRYLDISDADMEKGEMRVEANISLTPNSKLGTKAEIKNLNSFRAVEKAIGYEIKRQARILNSGKKIIHETRGWDDINNRTVSQRTKEEAHDYRYFPEPDLPPLCFREQEVLKIKAEIPELPEQKRRRLKREYELSDKEIEVFVQNRELGKYFEKVISELDPNLPKEKLNNLIRLTANYLITDLQGLLKGGFVSDRSFLITAENFADFITFIGEGKISSKIAKAVLLEMFKTGAEPLHIIEEKGLIQITDGAEIEKVVKEVLSQNQRAVDDFKKGKENALQFLIGQIMVKTKGKVNPQMAKDILMKHLM